MRMADRRQEGRKEGRNGESLRYVLLVSAVDNCVGEIRRAE